MHRFNIARARKKTRARALKADAQGIGRVQLLSLFYVLQSRTATTLNNVRLFPRFCPIQKRRLKTQTK